MSSTDPTAVPLGYPSDGASSAPSGGDHPIGDLVHQLLGAVQAAVAEADPGASSSSAGSLHPAEICYELDSVISQYLEHNELSPSQYEHIQQQVVNSLAHHLSGDGVHDGSSGLVAAHGDATTADGLLSLDHHGNADMADVLSLLHEHIAADVHAGGAHLGLGDFHPDPGFASGGHG
jgi:hypothetical protein